MEVKDADWPKFSEVIDMTGSKARIAWGENQTKTLIWVYYSGHGVMNNTTFAVCDKGTRAARAWYPLEKQLRMLAGIKGTYVVGVFDCCRAAITPAMRGEQRDGGAAVREDDGTAEVVEEED